MKRNLSLALVGIAACIAFFIGPARAAKGGKQPPNQNFLTRSDFRDDGGDGVRSDGQLVPLGCGPYDYVDNQDTCDPADVRTTSFLQTDGGYFLATRKSVDPLVDRWLVLDLGPGDDCPISDVDPDPDPECQVTVRFFADKAFHSQATSTPVRILIEKFDPNQGFWATKYTLDFVNPLSISPTADPNTVEIGAGQNDVFTADLWTVVRGKKRTFLGNFNMPFLLTLTKTNQVFVPGA